MDFLERALELAKKGIGLTYPNPCVGAVVVKDEKIIGEGYHKKAGEDHAEVIAIRNAQKKCSTCGASLYITLEPCCHYGKTPPCTDLIFSSGIKKVFVGMIDPFSKVCGRSIKILRKKGIEVKILQSRSFLSKKIREINQPFIKWIKTGKPYVILKVATSLDGKIATRKNESKWITSKKARIDARIERSFADAVLVGVNTVKADDPKLAIFGKRNSKKIKRTIIDPELSLDINKKVFRDNNVLVICTKRASEKNRKKFINSGIDFKVLGKKYIKIDRLLSYLGKIGVQSVYVEGGSEVHGYFYDAFLNNKKNIDKVIFYLAPKIIGGKNSLSAVGGKGVGYLNECPEFKLVETKKIGDNLKITGYYNIY